MITRACRVEDFEVAAEVRTAPHQSQLYLLPPDLRDWLPEGDLTHFVWLRRWNGCRWSGSR